MRSRAILFGALLLMAAVGGARAQEELSSGKRHGFFAELVEYRTLDLGRVERNFLDALSYPVDGVVESAIAQLARLKLAQPGCESARLREKIEYLAVHGPTTAIRFKAYLASAVFEQPELFKTESEAQYTDADSFFKALLRRIEEKSLAVN